MSLFKRKDEVENLEQPELTEQAEQTEQTGKKKVWFVVNIILTILVIVLTGAAVLLSRTYSWAEKTWSNLSMEEIVYHLNTTLDGSASDMVWKFVSSCVIITVAVVLALIIIFILLRRRKLPYHIVQIASTILSVVLIVTTFISANSTMGITEYFQEQNTYSSFIDDNYVDPNDVTLTFPEKKRNLIYIFLESMENTYSDTANGGAFDQNVIPELTTLAESNENFSGTEGGLNGGIPLKGCTWTIGAMFAQTCGLPLNIPIDKNAMSTQEEFFPGVTSIGNILEDEGYNQTLLIGSDAAFGGRDLYFQEHGDYTIEDYYAAIDEGKIPEDYYVWWGYEDNKLFENAKEILTDMSSQSEPFNLTMLTVDTHFEDGYVCEDCPSTYDTQYSNVMACSSKKVNDLVSWIQQQSWYENTTIVISGDHCTMDADYCNNVPADYQRSVFFTVINSPVERETTDRRTICTFDNFPTTLAALGVEIEGNRLGLGTNLYSSEQTLLERYSVDEANEGLGQQSELMDNLLAGIDTDMAEVKVNAYDPVSKTITATVSNIQYDQDVQSASVAVWTKSDQSDLKWYMANDSGGGVYNISIPATDFNVSGTYNLMFYADTGTATNTKIKLKSTSVDVQDTTFTATTESQTVTETSGSVYIEAYDSSTSSVNVYAVDVTTPNGVAGVSCAAWSKDDQSDIHWYGATEVDTGIYQVNLKAADFADNPSELQVHVYVIDNLGQTNLLEADTAIMVPETN